VVLSTKNELKFIKASQRSHFRFVQATHFSAFRNSRRSSVDESASISETLDSLHGPTDENETMDIPRFLPSTQYGLATMRSSPSVNDSEVIDGQRKMAQSVENVLCAYLNRHLVSSRKSDVPGSYAYAAKQAAIKSQAAAEYPWGPCTASTMAANETMNLAEFHPSLVYLCAPFAQCVRAEAGMYFAFERLMSMIGMYLLMID